MKKSPTHSPASGHAHPPALSVLAVFTAVLWMVFAAAGAAGLRLQCQTAKATEKPRPPVTAERLNVNVVKSVASSVASKAPPAPQPTIVVPSPLQPPPTLQLLPISEPKRSSLYSVKTSLPISASPSSPIEHLTFGQGGGDQPAPDYPREAKLAHQQGNVIVRMTIGENGDVTDAQVSSPCPWPILNQAALQVVRDSWHFPRGPVRVKDIEFVFELHQH